MPLFTPLIKTTLPPLYSNPRCRSAALSAVLSFIAAFPLAAAERHVGLGQTYNTIQAAADVAVAGDVVVIHAGTYREKVRPVNSGTSEANRITFRPHEVSGVKDVVIVSGADLLSSATSDTTWALKGGSSTVYELDLSTNFTSGMNQAEQLFIDGKMMILARYPDLPVNNVESIMPGKWLAAETSTPTDNGDLERYTITDAEFAPGADVVGATIWFIPMNEDGHGQGFVGSGTIASVSGTTVTFDSYRRWQPGGFHQFSKGDPYYIGNDVDLLNTAGEWYHNTTKLYAIAPLGSTLGVNNMEIKRRDFAFDLSDRDYITIRDIEVFAATITTDVDSGNDGQGNGATAVGRSSLHGSPIAGSDHVVLDGIKFRHINSVRDNSGDGQRQWVQTTGVILSGSFHKLENSLIEHAQGNGVMVIGSNNLVNNNIIYNSNYYGAFGAGINQGLEWNNLDTEIKNNTIIRTGFDGITAQNMNSTSSATPARIHHNRIQGFGLLTEDVGGIKAVGYSDNVNGSRWDHNLISHGDSYAFGLYHDFTRNYVMDHNVVWDTQDGMNMNGAQNHKVYNNTLIGRAFAITAFGDGQSSNTMDNTSVRNNLVYPANDIPITGVNNVLTPNTESKAVKGMLYDADSGDFKLWSGVDAINAGADLGAPYTPDGGAQGNWDTGAFEFGGTYWADSVGSNLAVLNGAPTNLVASRNASNGRPELKWSDNANNETKYYVERATEDGYLRRRFFQVAELDANTTSWTDTDDAGGSGSTMVYRVRANSSMMSNAAVLKTNLGARYAFDSTAELLNDISTEDAVANNGTASASAPTLDTADKKVGAGSLRFVASSSQSVTIPKNNEVVPERAITVMGWIKANSWNGGSNIITNAAANEDIGFGLGYSPATQKMRFNVGFTNADAPHFAENVPDIQTNIWAFVAGTYDGKHVKLFTSRDGAALPIEKASVARTDGNLNTAGPVRIGRHGYAADTFDGRIDDVRVYHRALSLAEIQAVFSGTTLAAPTIAVAATDTTISEAGRNPGAVTLSRTGDTDLSFKVDYTVNGSATASSGATTNDYGALPLSVLIPAGQKSANVYVTPFDDTINDANETVVVTNSGNSATLTIADNDGGVGPLPEITSALTASGTINTAITNYTITATNSPTSFNATGLPAGLSRSGAVISGTPTVSGTFNVSISATNANGTDTETLVITIAAAGYEVDRTRDAGGTINARASINADENAAKAFDNLDSPGSQNVNWSKWLDNGGVPSTSAPSWIQYDFSGDGYAINKYVITSANDESSRDPKNWRLKGSNAGTPDWSTATVLDTRSDQTFATRHLKKEYTFSNSTVYKKYRLEITANSGGVSLTQLDELRLYTTGGGGSVPSITSSLTASGIINTAFTSYAIAATNSPTSYAASPLPAGLSVNTSTGVITGTPTAPGTTNVTISATNGSGTGSATLVITINAASGGSISYEKWAGVGGVSVSDIPVSTTPNVTGTYTSMEIPVNAGEDYGIRLRGYLTPTSSGNYTFWIAGDDGVELWLSTDGTAANKVKIAFHNGWTDSREWNKAASQKSSAIALTSGTAYYIEALVKEQGGGDNLAVSWKLDNTTNPANGNGDSIITGSVLSPFGAGTAPVISSALTASGTQNVAFSSYTITASNSPTSYAASPLPAGLSVNTSTGVISGTPTASGTTNVSISATNGSGTGSTTLVITINVGAPVISSALTASGTQNVAFSSYTITASNSPTSYAASPLPAGLSVNTSTGVIGGTPTATGTTNVSISATNGSGTGSATLVITINSPSGLPSPWVNGAIGALSPNQVGSSSYNSGTGTYTVNGGGNDIWDNADRFQFVSQDSSGNCEIEARVTSVENTDFWAKAGVMIRESTAAGARFVMVCQMPNNEVSMQWRTATDGGADYNGSRVGGTGSVKYVRLVRSGNTFTGYYKVNAGDAWTTIGNIDVTMASAAKLGLAVTAHTNDGATSANLINTSTFTNVVATP